MVERSILIKYVTITICRWETQTEKSGTLKLRLKNNIKKCIAENNAETMPLFIKECKNGLLKGVLHPRSVFGLFLHFPQKLQHIGDK